MGILARMEQREPERRYTMADVADKVFEATGTKTKAGTTVTDETALNLSAVWAAVRVLTDTVASTPVHVYERLDPRGKQRAPTHPVYRLLHDRANPEMSAFAFKETLQGHAATWGNGYAEKERNGRGEVVALWPIAPHRVTPKRVDVRGKITKVFEVDVGGSKKVFGSDQIMHIPGFGYDGLVGYSAIRMARESLGLTKAAEEFGGRMFGSGLRAGGVLTHPKSLSDIARKNLRESIEKFSGGLDNAHRMMLLEDGLTWTQTSIPPEDAQFLETRKFQTVEIARWFKVPPHKIGDLERATFSNIEHQSIEFATDTARPWFIRWEQVFNWELFSAGDRGTYFAEFLMDALLRGDSAARAALHTALFNIGARSPNDARALENENPVEGGDRYYVQGAYVPIDKIDDVIDAKKAPPPAPTSAPEAPKPDPEPMARLRPVLLDAAERVLAREVEQLRAAIKRGNVEAWADGFYFAEHAGFAAKRFLPSCLAIDMPTGAKIAGKLGADWASASLADIRSTIRGGGDLATLAKRWEAGRAEEFVRSFFTAGPPDVAPQHVTNVTVAPAAAPVVNVAPPEVRVDVAPTEVNVRTPDVTVNVEQPKRTRTMTVTDAEGKTVRRAEISEEG